MNQQLRSDTRDSAFTTADLANASHQTSTAREFERFPNGPTAPEKRPSLVQDRAPFYNQADEAYNKPAEETDIDQYEAANKNGNSATALTEEDYATPLFSSEESNDLHARWNSVQVSFVDEPRTAVQEADSLVANAIRRLAEIFAEERARLDRQWDRGDNVSTEDLRIALRRYRSFFGRLLSI